MLERDVKDFGRVAAQLGTAAIRLCYPPVCEICNRATIDEPLCTACLTSACETSGDSVCPRCAATVGAFVAADRGCDLCSGERFAFERVHRLGRYQGTLARCCLRIKRPPAERLARRLTELLFACCGSSLQRRHFDVIVPAPLHWRRRWLRGYDQSGIIARHLGRLLKKPVRSNILYRRRATATQATLSPTRRRENLRGAFERCRFARLDSGCSVLLVDDILTTGATAHNAARLLRAMGADRIYVAVLARGDHAPR